MNLGQRRLQMVVEVHETMILNPLGAHLGDNPANDLKRRLTVMRFPRDVSRSLIQRTVEAPSSGVRFANAIICAVPDRCVREIPPRSPDNLQVGRSGRLVLPQVN